MADNFSFSEGNGKTGAADEIGGVLYPRVKVGWGPDGTFNDADAASGKALPVQLRDASGNAVAPLTESTFDTKIGALTETAPTTDTASSGLNGRLQRIAQRITSLIALLPSALTGSGNFKVAVQEALPAGTANIGDVDVLTLPADPLGANADAAATAGSTGSMSAKLRLITSQLDSIKTAVETLDNVVSGNEAQVDIVGALPAGTNNIGDVDVASIAAGDNNIGNVDVVTLPADPLGANADAAATAGSTGSISAKLRTATQQLEDIKTAVQLIDNAISGNEVQVDVVTSALPTGASTLAEQQSQTTHLATIAGDTTDIETAVELLDDIVKTDDAGFTPATDKVAMVGFQADESSTDSVDEGDAGAARMTLDRKVIVTPQPHTAGGLSIFRSIDLDETEEEIKASAGQIYGMWVTNTATSTRFVKFYNATAANVTVGSTTPVITIGIPGNSSDDVSGLLASTHGIMFDTAITAAATTGVADADTGAPGANEVIINVFYK